MSLELSSLEEWKMKQEPSQTSSHVLIVDDEPDIVLSLQDLLEGEGYRIGVANTGKAALDSLKRNSVDTVLLDICLPDIDGLLILEEMAHNYPGLPIIVLSALTSLDRVVGPLDQQGAFAYLHKPINRSEVRTTVRQALRAHQLVQQMTRTQQALIDSELRFQAVFHNAADAIVLADSHGLITGWNRAAESMFGYTVEEVYGKPLTLLMPTRYREAHVQGLKRMTQTGKTKLIGKTVQLYGHKKNGLEFPIELSLNSWTTGPLPSFSGFIRDISMRKDILATPKTE